MTEPLPGSLREIYLEVMKPEDIDLTSEDARFIVRLWDGMDGCWCDVTVPIQAQDALIVWAERTKNGTEKVGFDEIDYFRIFPHDTRMQWDGTEGKEMFR